MTRLLSAATLALMAGGAHAQVAVQGAPQAIAAELQRLGYDHIEIEVGPTRTEVEAVDIERNRKVEYVFVNGTTDIISYEEETPDDDEDLTRGIEIEYEDDDDHDDDDDEEDGSDDDSDDDDDDDDSSDDDDSDDEDEGDDDSGGESDDD